MAKAFIAPILSAALGKFKEIVTRHQARADEENKRLIVFCEDRLSLVAERAVCEAVGGTFSVSVFTLSRFLSAEKGLPENLLTSQGSAMTLRKIIDENKGELQLFRRLSTATAAQEVYDTIALLYSSRISPEDLADAQGGSELLKRKLHDIAFLYEKYFDYLEEHGAVDRNAYLRRLPQVIRASQKIVGADVAFLGFNAFTSSVAECVRACIQTANEVYGIFIGDRAGLGVYQNEAVATFLHVAEEEGQREPPVYLPSPLPPAAERLRRHLFDPECFAAFDDVREALDVAEVCNDPTVSLTAAADEEEECAFIAAHVVKCIKEEGVRYRNISVMLPDLPAYQPVLERAFAEYGIPCYVDRRYPLSSHPVCAFVLGYLACAADGMCADSVAAVVTNPLFRAPVKAKDLFVNYLLRAASSRGGVAREINADICAELGRGEEDESSAFAAVSGVREMFLKGMKPFRREANGEKFCAAVRELLDLFRAEKSLKEDAADEVFAAYPAASAMSSRAYDALLQVLGEAEKLTAGERYTARAFTRILKSGFTAAEISLIPPKQDAVFVGDLSSTANTGSEIVFVAGLTDAVPKTSQDTSVLTDGELNSLEKLQGVSPKIAQVNMRVREITALNLCAFARRLYLVYPLRSGGEECGRSEIVGYAKHLFRIGGTRLSARSARDIAQLTDSLPYYCSAPAPALRLVARRELGAAAVYDVLRQAQKRIEAKDAPDPADEEFIGALKIVGSCGKEEKKPLSEGAKLYGDRISPTALETYFSCPYKAFMERGLRLEERKEGELRPLDSGNFIHAVLEEFARKLSAVTDERDCVRVATEIAESKLREPAYAALNQDGRGAYLARSLAEEAAEISLGMYRQLKNSSFEISSTESVCEIGLESGFTVGGRIDRVDTCGDMVRIIDYKTGSVDSKAESYYMGLKLQLPLYLLSASAGKRAAGAYYFPAKVEYSASPSETFCLKGFMDGSADVVRCSDATVREKERSAYVDAYLNGTALDCAMSREDFGDFIEYSLLIAENGARDMRGGKVAPSPADKACDYCKYVGCCLYDKREEGSRPTKKVNCKQIAEIVRGERAARGEKR